MTGGAHGEPVRIVDWLVTIRGEFGEPSQLRLTIAEASERWSLDAVRLRGLLDALVQVGYLRLSPDGVYYRRRPDSR